MAIFKCKMCGGTIEFEQGATVGVCDSCGTKQTLPRLDDEKKTNLYDRANHFRRNNDFDKAMGIYEQILNEDSSDAEAYWSLVLCRYGIEYVEDPASHKRIPTVNRAQFTSIYMDEDYKSALKYADSAQKAVYEAEAKAIDDIQKGILAISSKEEPFDVFICYKETDSSGRRTQDSVLANDLYHQLTQEGFKVFFSRITLEDKLGAAYEPYIFAALNSAKVMVVLGTKPENFNAVWVKNEWSRYLALIKQGQKKMLIPAYKDMDPYDLPEEFSHLQAQDMSKLGFMQDLIRGIKKVLEASGTAETDKQNVLVQSEGANNLQALLDRGYMALEDGEWEKADAFFEDVLNQNAKCAEAYQGKLMAELCVHKQEELKNCKEPFDNSKNFERAVRFGSEGLVSTLYGCVKHVRLEGAYNQAKAEMKKRNYKEAEKLFNQISGYKDSADLAKDSILAGADLIYNDSIFQYEQAIKRLESIHGWKDADEKADAFRKKIKELQLKEEADRLETERKAKAKKRRTMLAGLIFCACAVLAIAVATVLPQLKLITAAHKLKSGDYDSAYALLEELGEDEAVAANKYDRANELLNSGDYDSAYSLLEEIGKSEAVAANKYDRANELLNSGDYDSAYSLLEEIGKSEVVVANKYDRAEKLIESGDYEAAYGLLSEIDYKDSNEKRRELAVTLIKDGKYGAFIAGDIIPFGAYEQDNDTANGKEPIEWIVLTREENRILVISKYALDCRQYNDSTAGTTWESCTLRTWLNETFLQDAFSDAEQQLIQTTTVTADANPEYNTDPGHETEDKVFLLSIPEAKKYFTSAADRRCVPTEYAVEQGGSIYGKENECGWWLRSPGAKQQNAAFINSKGNVNPTGRKASDGDISVRPALWISLDA